VARSALRPAEVDAFRRRLAAAATRLFARHGYAAVTMRAVAAELGVSAMTPYRYVAGKAELVALVRAAAFPPGSPPPWRSPSPTPAARPCPACASSRPRTSGSRSPTPTTTG
jgi:hypothetical protein